MKSAFIDKMVEWWQRYWFSPGALVNLAIVRILAVGYQLWYLLTFNNLALLAERASLPDNLYAPVLALRIMLLPFGSGYRPSFELLEVVFWITVAAGGLALVGFRTNLSLVVFTIGALFIQTFVYSFGDFHHPEAILIMALALLALSPSGEVLSVDHWLRQRRRGRRAFDVWDLSNQTSVLATWPLLLTQWLFSLIYFSAALSKVLNSGLDWMNGYTLRYYMLTATPTPADDWLPMLLGQNFLVVTLLSWAVILFEGTFFLVLIFPRLAWIYVPIGIGMHASIQLMGMAPFPQYMLLYSVFVPWDDVIKWTQTRVKLTAVNSAKA
ncbi:MAG TPA: hypothetical protein PLP42_19050 [Acidobacteriota bacterium]|jgi:hypothetical protein|nr:hypothetical protein [Acidobacteriota bacterium]